jgi:hypothetical protein
MQYPETQHIISINYFRLLFFKVIFNTIFACNKIIKIKIKIKQIMLFTSHLEKTLVFGKLKFTPRNENKP